MTQWRKCNEGAQIQPHENTHHMDLTLRWISDRFHDGYIRRGDPLITYPPSHHITSHHITSHHITSHHITSHHITWDSIGALHSCPHDKPSHIQKHFVPRRSVTCSSEMRSNILVCNLAPRQTTFLMTPNGGKVIRGVRYNHMKIPITRTSLTGGYPTDFPMGVNSTSCSP